MRQIPNSTGFTLLEVLIALLVMSLGLMGLAGLLVVSVRTNHSAYLHTQASFLAQSMAERMRANMLGVWNGDYTVASGTATMKSALAAVCITPAVCDPLATANRDIAIWDSQLTTFLPTATRALTCTGGAALSTDELVKRPPFSGQCQITIQWTEQPIDKNANTAAVELQTFAWVFQP